MRKLVITTVAGLGLAGMIAFSAAAQDAATDKQRHVLAKVNDTEVTLEDVITAYDNLPQRARTRPFQQMAGLLLNRLIDQKVVGSIAEKSGVADSEAFLEDLAIARERLLLKAWLTAELAARVSDDVIQSTYQEMITSIPPETQMEVSHILVKTEEEAKAAIAELDGGKAFADVAKNLSTGPSAPQGGLLGWIKKTQVVKPFGDAAFDLKDGEISAPVKSDFGWHVIMGGKTREAPKPTLEQLEAQVRARAEQQQTEAILADLRKDATIEMFDMQGNPLEQQPAKQ